MKPIKAFAAAALVAVTAPAFAAQPVTGRWVTEDKAAVVEIAPCGQKLCGKIVKFLKTPPRGFDQRDIHNPDKSLRSRKLMGLPVLTGFSEDGDEWRGEIYDPKTGKTYRSLLQRKSAGQLQVKGCIGPFCKTQTWNRAG
ncbi:DUF2147 domain-containing protein [Novosphingopyxis sp. YJ-S2-01]|uniref:DUF2147 domain-containing protein n=1 Tax=Novosphingopyxis sp. YJ-S2-01 TaxID=2794021 RepID=UPI0018DC4E35|nr:DUF2147 domain-containing protein [Novosphingopyxis sp. YJ-S2-01]